MRVPLLLVAAILLSGLAHAVEPISVAAALCRHAPAKAFKPSRAPRLPDDDLLRALLSTDDPTEIRRAMGGSDPNAPRGTAGSTPLAVAAASGNVSGVNVLLDSGALVEGKSRSGTTPLEAAILNIQPSTACALLSRGAILPEPRSKPYLLPAAALSEDFGAASAMVGFLLDRGYDVNARTNGDTALHIAAELGNETLVMLLLRHGADIKLKNGRSETPEAVAQRAGFPGIAKRIRDAVRRGRKGE
jgi:uncharacterized protein